MSRFVIMATWDDCGHLTDEEKKTLYASYLPHERDARSKGIPALGSGAIFPLPESEIVVKPFAIPPSWPKAYGFDVGWNKTAAIWGALDVDSDTLFLYSEHYRGKAEPSIHADAIKARGSWIGGAIDPAARGRSQKDGTNLLDIYYDLGLDIIPADNAVEAGLQLMWQRLSSGRLKVFASCGNWISEFRVYRRDDKGKVVKKSDHLMDATRYLLMSGLDISAVEPVETINYEPPVAVSGKNAVTGY